MGDAGGECAPTIYAGNGIFAALKRSVRVGQGCDVGCVTSPSLTYECVKRVFGITKTRKIREIPAIPRATIGDVVAASATDGHLVEATRVFRESVWSVREDHSLAGKSAGGVMPVWEEAVLDAMRRALELADQAGVVHAGPAHLLVALLRDPRSESREILRQINVDPLEAVRRVEATGALRRDSQPHAPAAAGAWLLGLAAGAPWPLRPWLAINRAGIARHTNLPPVLHILADEANRLAIRLGHGKVTPLHLIAAIVSFHDQLILARTGLRPDVGQASLAGGLVRRRLRPRREISTLLVGIGESDLADVTPGPATRRKGPPWTAAAMRAIDRVAGTAGSKSTKVGSSHLFLAVLDEPDDAVRRLFAQLEFGLDGAREEIAESLR